MSAETALEVEVIDSAVPHGLGGNHDTDNGLTICPEVVRCATLLGRANGSFSG
jgi:hypothetical protein